MFLKILKIEEGRKSILSSMSNQASHDFNRSCVSVSEYICMVNPSNTGKSQVHIIHVMMPALNSYYMGLR